MQSNFDTFDKNFFDGPGHHLGMSDFDWADVQNKITEYAGYITGNPAAVASSIATQQTIKAIENSGRTLTQAEKDQIAASNGTAVTKVLKKSVDDNIVEPALGFLSSIKWIIYAVIAVILLGLFLRIRG